VPGNRTLKDPQAFRRKRAAFWQDNDLVFCTGNSLVLHPNNVLRKFDAIVAATGVPEINLHDLRHTHATFLLLDGVPLKVVSERPGHAKTSITLDTYAHILPGFQHLAVKSIREALFGKCRVIAA
jgi:integrase